VQPPEAAAGHLYRLITRTRQRAALTRAVQAAVAGPGPADHTPAAATVAAPPVAWAVGAAAAGASAGLSDPDNPDNRQQQQLPPSLVVSQRRVSVTAATAASDAASAAAAAASHSDPTTAAAAAAAGEGGSSIDRSAAAWAALAHLGVPIPPLPLPGLHASFDWDRFLAKHAKFAEIGAAIRDTQVRENKVL
jgi:hypothetical protein